MADPFKIIEPTCISFSGGRTSAYMLWRVLQSHGGKLPEDAVVCFANTGKEDEATLRFVKACSENWNIEIHWVEFQKENPKFKVVNFESASRDGQPFAELIKKKNYLPNPIARFCTEELKVKTINRFLKSKGIDDASMMIGVRADEHRRLPKLRARGLLVPLAMAKVNQEIVQNFWKQQHFDLDLIFRDGITALGNCDLCFMKGSEQIKGLIKDNPQRATWWVQQENTINATFRHDRPSYKELQIFIDNQADMFNTDGGIDCFCGD